MTLSMLHQQHCTISMPMVMASVGLVRLPMSFVLNQTVWWKNSTDCDDSNRFSNPEGVETCDGVDNDCDFMVDDEDDDIDLSTDAVVLSRQRHDNIGANVEGIQTCEQPTMIRIDHR